MTNDTDTQTDGEEPNGRTWKRRERSLAIGVVLWSLYLGLAAWNDPDAVAQTVDAAGFAFAGLNMLAIGVLAGVTWWFYPFLEAGDA